MKIKPGLIKPGLNIAFQNEESGIIPSPFDKPPD